MGQVEDHWGSEWTDHKEKVAPYKVEPSYPTKPDKSWRPDGWVNPLTATIIHPALFDKEAEIIIHRYDDFEAGATAMLEAIWKLAKESPTGCFTFDTREIDQFNNRVKRG
jgi:hypothetical protein